MGEALTDGKLHGTWHTSEVAYRVGERVDDLWYSDCELERQQWVVTKVELVVADCGRHIDEPIREAERAQGNYRTINLAKRLLQNPRCSAPCQVLDGCFRRV